MTQLGLPPRASSSLELASSDTWPQYLLGGFRIAKRQTYGVELALLASVILAGSSIPRAIKTGKPLPAGLSALAVTGLVIYGRAFLAKA